MLKAIGGFLDMVPSFVWALLVAGLLATTCAERNVALGTKVKLAQSQQSFSEYREKDAEREQERAHIALVFQQGQADLERFRNKAAADAEERVRNEKAASAAALLKSAGRERLLKSTIDQFTAARADGGQACRDSEAFKRSQEGAATLGLLLETCRREGSEDARELEDLAAQIRGIKAIHESLEPTAAPPLQSTP